MKTSTSLLSFCILIPFFALSQVGIGTTNPNALLDIESSNQALPSNTDGILIPKVDEYPAIDPTAAQDGMMLFATGGGSVAKGFYYWDNSTTSWIPLTTSVVDDAWYEESTTTVPNNINDDIYTMGNVAIGKNTADYPLDVNTTGTRAANIEVSGSSSGIVYGLRLENSNSGGGGHYGTYQSMSGTGNGVQQNQYNIIINSGNGIHVGVNNGLYGGGTGEHYGVNNNLSGSGEGNLFGIRNNVDSTGDGDHYGIQNNLSEEGNGDHYGAYNSLFGTGIGTKYGSYNFVSPAAGGTHYGLYSNVLKANSFAGYFLGRVSIGITGANNYILPASRGTANQVMQTDGGGNASWVDTTSFGVQEINDLTDGITDTTSLFLGTNSGSLDDGVLTGSTNSNVGIGQNAFSSNVSGERNTAVGYRSMSSNDSGGSNTAIGHQSLETVTSSSSNVAIGSWAARYSTGGSNTVVGATAFTDNTAGDNNTILGALSARNLNGNNNTMLGYQTGSNSFSYTMDGSVFIGYNVGFYETNSNRLYIDNSGTSTPLIYGEFDNDVLRVNGEFQIGDPASSGYAFEAVDGTAGQVIQTDGSGNASWVDASTIGTDNQNITGSSLSGNVLTIGIENGGSQSLNLSSLVGAESVNDLSDGKSDGMGFSIVLGTSAGLNGVTTNQHSTGLGYQVLQNNAATASNNTAIGFRSLRANTTGVSNTATGNSSLLSNTIGRDNTAIGSGSLFHNTEGRYNLALGSSTLAQNLIGNFNTAVGAQAGSNATGNRNVFLGYQAGSNETGDEKLYIDNTNADADSALIYGEFDTDFLRINADMEIGLAAGANVKLLSDDGGYASLELYEGADYGFEFQYHGGLDQLNLWSRRFAGNEDIRMTWLKNGNVGIGVVTPAYKLDVAGDINTTGNIRQSGGAYSFPDYVFESYFEGSSSFMPNYKRLSLSEVKTFLKENKHLPGVQSRAEVSKNGWNVSENVRSNLEKIEELYLYAIEANNKIEAISEQNEALKSLLAKQQKDMDIIMSMLTKE